MSKKLRVAIAQMDFIVGDIAGNLKKHLAAAAKARDELKADIIVFPELSITGYPPEDLLLRPAFIKEANQALEECKKQIKDIYFVIGHPHKTAEGLYNSCSFIYNDRILTRYDKNHLPNYGVFDETRYFIPGNLGSIIEVKGIPIAITICEDLWFPGPALHAANSGARIILSPNASPFEIDKQEQRERMLKKRVKAINIPIVYANCVGGQDELVFDGGSMVINGEGRICQHAGFFNETLLSVDFEVNATKTLVQTTAYVLPSEDEKIYQCLVKGLKDYVEKNRFPGVLLGLSGGIDSALVLAIAVDALGKDKVRAMIMPSRFTVDMSLEDANSIAKNLGVKAETISIEPTYKSFLASLETQFAHKKPDITEENLQARCRAVLLMALSNQTGSMVLTTSNRSEMAVGYSTLYGDMAGGFSVIRDVPKMMVYRLARYRNSVQHVIPERVLERAPTAELAFDQKDEDSLPPYPVLDRILECYLDLEQSVEEIAAQGFDRDVVTRVVTLVYRNEYKRRQAALGTRIKHKAFGKDRRYPVVCGFLD